eukprot:scaffold3720_cov141-Cylindrotheca_fusiformis.AAC.16
MKFPSMPWNVGFFLFAAASTEAFMTSPSKSSTSRLTQELQGQRSKDLALEKEKLFKLIGRTSSADPVLADPITKEDIQISSSGVMFGGDSRRSVQYNVRSPSNKFQGSSDTFIDLLEPVTEGKTETASSTSKSPLNDLIRQTAPYIPVPLRQPLAAMTDGEYIPMRDLFTNPAVSFAYERGWRQGFAQAGFPGPDTEADMAMDYFAPATVLSGDVKDSVIVDMSCATGLFTRRFASRDRYGRVLGCDYSAAMLTEARRRINQERSLSKLKTTKLDLVRLDVGQIPMKNETINCLHAGAAMHCWPDLDSAFQEIYRVLTPGGRYFGTTFLSTYFSTLSSMDGQANVIPSQRAFQYFESADTLKTLLENGGFESDKIQIEILGRACAVIRAEK